MDGLQTYWINITNISLGAVTLVCVISVLAGVIDELLSRRKRRKTVLREIDSDVQRLFLHGVTPLGAGQGGYYRR